MKIAIIDADLVGNKKHRFPNLVCMKISGYHKELGDDVELKLDYDNLSDYDKVYISKVFINTEIPGEPKDKTGKNENTVIEWYKDNEFLKQPNIEYGGTGFFYDKAPALPEEIEHHMPDYHLYDKWVDERLADGGKRIDFKYYLDYSIGYVTRGCFRGCEFCVNRNCKKVTPHSPIEEFYDTSRKKICLLDDNFLGCKHWKEILLGLQEMKLPFQFKQGLDERILNDEKCEILFKSRYDGDYIFAFDNIADREIIEKKARLIRHYYKNKGRNIKFYVFCAFDRNDKWDMEFWLQDIKDTFKRIFILAKYNFSPYIMRHESYKTSPLYGTYVNIACWANTPSLFNNLSYRQFCEKDDLRKSGGKGTSATWRYFEQLLELNPDFEEYFDIVPKSIREDYSDW